MATERSHSRAAFLPQNGWPVGIRCKIGLLAGAEAGCGRKIEEFVLPVELLGEVIGPGAMAALFIGTP